MKWTDYLSLLLEFIRHTPRRPLNVSHFGMTFWAKTELCFLHDAHLSLANGVLIEIVIPSCYIN